MITRWSQGDAHVGMDESLLEATWEDAARHPWFGERARFLLALLADLGALAPSAVLDAGCGWGITLEALERVGYRPTGLDVSRRTLERLDRANRELIEADLTLELPRDAPRFPVVLALDLLEHLDDDAAVLTRLASMVTPEGALIVAVPAGPGAWSDFDEIAGHRRRYDRRMLVSTFARAGLPTPKVHAWGMWMRPAMAWTRRRPGQGQTPQQRYQWHLRPPGPVADLLFRQLCRIEGPLARRALLPTGSSWFATLRVSARSGA